MGNSFTRKKPLYVKAKPSLFISTKRQYYGNAALHGEAFLYNRTGTKQTNLARARWNCTTTKR